MSALRQKKAFESELDRLAGTRMTLETQVGFVVATRAPEMERRVRWAEMEVETEEWREWGEGTITRRDDRQVMVGTAGVGDGEGDGAVHCCGVGRNMAGSVEQRAQSGTGT